MTLLCNLEIKMITTWKFAISQVIGSLFVLPRSVQLASVQTHYQGSPIKYGATQPDLAPTKSRRLKQIESFSNALIDRCLQYDTKAAVNGDDIISLPRPSIPAVVITRRILKQHEEISSLDTDSFNAVYLIGDVSPDYHAAAERTEEPRPII